MATNGLALQCGASSDTARALSDKVARTGKRSSSTLLVRTASLDLLHPGQRRTHRIPVIRLLSKGHRAHGIRSRGHQRSLPQRTKFPTCGGMLSDFPPIKKLS